MVDLRKKQDIILNSNNSNNDSAQNNHDDSNEFSSLKAKEYFSTINPPLFIEKDDVYVIQKCVVELHILQGYVNHLFWDGLVPLFGREKSLLWPKKVGVVAKDYQGEIFEVNTCREMLKQANKLSDDKICEHIGGTLTIAPFVSAFKAMDKIVNSCFSRRKVDYNLDKKIKE